VAANWPSTQHTVRAANVVIFELIRALAQKSGIKLAFLKVSRPTDIVAGDDERVGLAAVAALGVDILPEVKLLQPQQRAGVLTKLIFPSVEHFYPEVLEGQRIATVLADWNADAIMVPWSEWLTAACSQVNQLKFAYYGNPDHKSGRIRSWHDLRLRGLSVGFLRTQLGLFPLEHAHNAIMKRYELVGDVAQNDAKYYVSKGHPNAFYIRNVWIDRFGSGWRERRRALEIVEPLVIIGNVGKLDGTANRLGLEYLGTDLLPALRKRLAPGTFRVEVLGAGQLDPQIKRHFAGSEVVFRGFVPDIDEAILAAPIFLCVNNATRYKVGHTRYLHAWSLGATVIAHEDAALSMPEIKHEQNALLGRNGEEIADLIVRAGKDRLLRERLGEGGWETYRTQFTAECVATDIIRQIVEYRSSGSKTMSSQS
jgi:hypothetical protein